MSFDDEDDFEDEDEIEDDEETESFALRMVKCAACKTNTVMALASSDPDEVICSECKAAGKKPAPKDPIPPEGIRNRIKCGKCDAVICELVAFQHGNLRIEVLKCEACGSKPTDEDSQGIEFEFFENGKWVGS